MSRTRSVLATTAGVLLSAVFLAIALRGVELAQVAAAFRDARLWLAVPFLGVLFLFYWVKAARWAELLSPIAACSARNLFASVMIGYAGSALLPMQLGEIARSYLAARQLRLSPLAVLMSIALERVLDLLGILVLLGAALVVGHNLPPILVTAGYALVAASTVAAGLLAAYLLKTDAFVRLTERCTRFLPATLGRRISAQVAAGAAGLQALRSSHLLGSVMFTTLLQWVLMAICVWLSLTALGIAGSINATFLVLVLMTIGISLPNSPGYVGSIQLAYTLALKPLGIAAGTAIAASLFFHVLTYSAVVLAGFFFLHRLGIRFADLASEPADAPARR